MSDDSTLKSEAFEAAGWSFADELREMMLWSIRYDERRASPTPAQEGTER